MTNITWMFKGREFAHCNCAYGCPCKFSARPTHGDCRSVVSMVIDEGYHGDTRLDGLRFAAIFCWPGAIHEGQGEAVFIVDERASSTQRDAILRIMSGQDTEPGATVFHVFGSTLQKLHAPIFAKIDLEIDVDARRAHLRVPGVVDARGEPILNPVTKQEHRARFDTPNGFEFKFAEAGRGWATASGTIELRLSDSHAQFVKLQMSGSGVLR